MTSAVGTKNVWPNYAANNTSGSTSSGSGVLGKDDFLKILVAQLSNQDPMQPMEDKEFIAQMAQFSSVEQMYNITSELKTLRQSIGLSPALIGKSVAWNDTNTNGTTTEKTGVVEGIRFKSGLQYAIIDGKDVSIDQLTRIWEEAASNSTTTTGSGTTTTTTGTGSTTTATGTGETSSEANGGAQESGSGL
ncbi:flagellar hook capping FlgD N-terminal domain-containing protein [Gorillibacterium massiliense]|uniref:flagellar hook capping FlgD N-terminal domain-containing protein n=1 Tax=Gorillibacterium massiliense TaxID=1280390 RepID=UPI0004B1C4A4|nr:flagellar hook capping FlgD N-terminal domain-containing protein [Gorillibacterium massiliense]